MLLYICIYRKYRFNDLRWHELYIYCIFYKYCDKGFMLLYGMVSFMCSSDKNSTDIQAILHFCKTVY